MRFISAQTPHFPQFARFNLRARGSRVANVAKTTKTSQILFRTKSFKALSKTASKLDYFMSGLNFASPTEYTVDIIRRE
jgi:hypothetical protein